MGQPLIVLQLDLIRFRENLEIRRGEIGGSNDIIEHDVTGVSKEFLFGSALFSRIEIECSGIDREELSENGERRRVDVEEADKPFEENVCPVDLASDAEGPKGRGPV